MDLAGTFVGSRTRGTVMAFAHLIVTLVEAVGYCGHNAQQHNHPDTNPSKFHDYSLITIHYSLFTLHFYLESSFLKVFPIVRIRFRDHTWIIDDEAIGYEGIGCKGQGHTVVVIGVDTLFQGWFATLAVPIEFATVNIMQYESEFPHFAFQGLYAVGLLNLQGGKSLEMEGDAFCGSCHDEGLSQVGRVDEVVLQSRQTSAILGDGDRLGDALLLRLEGGLHA